MSVRSHLHVHIEWLCSLGKNYALKIIQHVIKSIEVYFIDDSLSLQL